MSYINEAYGLGQRAAVEDFYREKNAGVVGEVAERTPGLIERMGKRLVLDAALGVKAIPDAASLAGREGRGMLGDIRRAPKAFEEAQKGIDPVMEQIRAAKELEVQRREAREAYLAAAASGTPKVEEAMRSAEGELYDKVRNAETGAQNAAEDHYRVLQDAESKANSARNMKRQVGLIGASLAGTAAGGVGGYYTADKAGLGTGGKVLGTLAGAGLGTLAGGHLRASRFGIPQYAGTPVSEEFMGNVYKAVRG